MDHRTPLLSIFSIRGDVDLTVASVLIISHFGASEDLVSCAEEAGSQGLPLMATANQPGSAVELSANVTFPIAADHEPAFKVRPITQSLTGLSAIAFVQFQHDRPWLGYRWREDRSAEFRSRVVEPVARAHRHGA